MEKSSHEFLARAGENAMKRGDNSLKLQKIEDCIEICNSLIRSELYVL